MTLEYFANKFMNQEYCFLVKNDIRAFRWKIFCMTKAVKIL